MTATLLTSLPGPAVVEMASRGIAGRVMGRPAYG
jgi:hypothetical protein